MAHDVHQWMPHREKRGFMDHFRASLIKWSKYYMADPKSPMTMGILVANRMLTGIHWGEHEIKGLLKKVVIPNNFQFNNGNYQQTWRAQLRHCKQIFCLNISEESRSYNRTSQWGRPKSHMGLSFTPHQSSRERTGEGGRTSVGRTMVPYD